MIRRQVLMTFVLSALVLVPALATAQTLPNIVPKGCQTGRPCSLCDFVNMTQNVINAAITLSVFLGAVLFAYAGWLYLTARGDTGQIKRAHRIFANVAIGLVIVLAGWLIVDTIMRQLTGGSFGARWSSGLGCPPS